MAYGTRKYGGMGGEAGNNPSWRQSPYQDDDDDDFGTTPAPWSARSTMTASTPTGPGALPRSSYLHSVDYPSLERTGPAAAKSKLLVSDLDNTLFGPSGDGVVARPYLKTFIKYIMHPTTAFNLAIWTFSGRQFGIAHLRQVGMGKYLFDSDSLDQPKFKPGLEALWGYEDSGFLRDGLMAAGKPLKDLDLMWDFIHLTRGEEYGSATSLIVDDQVSNARAQPDSIVEAPVFTSKSPDDDFLLAFIGVLEELALESNIAAAIAKKRLYSGIALKDLDYYVDKAKVVCRTLGIKVSRGTAYPDPAYIEDVKENKAAPVIGPAHDAAEEPAEPHPGSLPFFRPSPKRVAKGMVLHPSAAYERTASIPSKVVRQGKVKPLVVFDLDGTLYTRPPQNLEHDPSGEPAGRPYLRTFLQWLFRSESPYHVAIWTGSQKATAARCLYQLDLGLVGPKLVGPHKDEAELLHPKLVALWAREDLGLTPQDYVSYVSIVKDLDKLWDHLRSSSLGDFSPLNTAMVDDTPSKLRAQPSTLITAPTFDYPLSPSDPSTFPAIGDTFLLSLVAMLDDLTVESNFAEYINAQGWDDPKGQSQDELVELRERGLKMLKKAGVFIAAEGRGLIEGVMPSVNDPDGVRTASKGGNAIFRSTTAQAPLTASNLHTADVNSDTDNASSSSSTTSSSASSTTSESVDGDSDVAAEEARARSKDVLPASRRTGRPSASGRDALRERRMRVLTRA
ncbi:hypothetical protein JCM8547_006422 [Rhodosporidiobolus lusitaniae]